MTRLSTRFVVPPLEQIRFDLLLGPTMPTLGVDEYTEEELEIAWGVYGHRVMADWFATDHRPGHRPRVFWLFDVGEEPDTEEGRMLLLAERGELTRRELEILAERRTWVDINDGSKHEDPEAIALYEAVMETLDAATPDS